MLAQPKHYSREQLHFRVGCLDEANGLVRTCHYSGRPPANVQCVGTWHEDGGLFGGDGQIIAACFFSLPPTRWAEPVLELSRLVRIDGVKIDLTALIAATCDFIRQNRAFDLLVSFADQKQGHHGGVYQAASWNYDGQRDTRMDGILWNGSFMPGRSCNSKWGTQSPTKLREILGSSHSIEPHYDVGKHLYWRALNKHGTRRAARLGLRRLAYFKPEQAARTAAA